MDDTWFFIKVSAGAIIALVAIIFGIVVFANGMHYWVENVPLRVILDGKEVYKGRSACVNTESVGSSSRVNVSGGFLCIWPKEYFAGKNLVIKTEE